jgi:hypothetical protein
MLFGSVTSISNTSVQTIAGKRFVNIKRKKKIEAIMADSEAH